jgi:hypothetical protein
MSAGWNAAFGGTAYEAKMPVQFLSHPSPKPLFKVEAVGITGIYF